MTADSTVRQQLLSLLQGGNAHMTFDQALDAFPLDQINAMPPGVPYSFWHLLEHVRIAQWDILEFTRDPGHESPPWPEGYWPEPDSQASPGDWQHTLDRFRADAAALVAMVQDPATDLYADLPHAPGYTVLREILLVADHNAYHMGELAILRQTMGLWA